MVESKEVSFELQVVGTACLAENAVTNDPVFTSLPVYIDGVKLPSSISALLEYENCDKLIDSREFTCEATDSSSNLCNEVFLSPSSGSGPW